MDWPTESVMLVTNRRSLRQGSLTGLVAALARAGLDWVQVREKDLPGRALLEQTRDLVGATHGTATRVIVNGRPDMAVAAGAAGVQLPEEGLPVAAVRRAFPSLLIGASCHSADGIARAAAAGASFALLGPVFATPGKETWALGVDVLRSACETATIPVVAVGGIDRSSAAAAWHAGAQGVAAIRHFLESAPEEAVRDLRRGASVP
jgi:thiamine-phosphate pyrophosphorylase